MTIVDMHFDFKEKMNKIDSQTFINYRIPEIDRFLNDGMMIFIKNIAYPRNVRSSFVEKNQRTIDDIRTIVKEARGVTVNDGSCTLPKDYMFYVKAEALCQKNGNTKNLRVLKRKHKDRFEEDSFYNSSFEWGELMGYFRGEELMLFPTADFTVISCDLSYIRSPKYMHNANGIRQGSGYSLGDGNMLTGTQDCELPDHTHNEIVDLAVMIAKGIVHQDSYRASQDKLRLDNLV